MPLGEITDNYLYKKIPGKQLQQCKKIFLKTCKLGVVTTVTRKIFNTSWLGKIISRFKHKI